MTAVIKFSRLVPFPVLPAARQTLGVDMTKKDRSLVEPLKEITCGFSEAPSGSTTFPPCSVPVQRFGPPFMAVVLVTRHLSSKITASIFLT